MSSVVGPSPPVTKRISQRENNSTSVPHNGLRVRNRAPFLDPQPQGKNLPRDKHKMRVLNVAEQQLSAGIYKHRAHRKL